MAEALTLQTFRLPAGVFKARALHDGVLVDPVEPKGLDCTPNEHRPPAHDKWWHLPFIVTCSVEQLDALYAQGTDANAEQRREDWRTRSRPQWLTAWPGGVRFTVRCLDGGAWDRTTNWGSFPTLAAAIEVAKAGPTY